MKKKEQYGMAVYAPIVGVRSSDVQTLAGTDEGRRMLAVFLLVRSGASIETVQTWTSLDRSEVVDLIGALLENGMLDRDEVKDE